MVLLVGLGGAAAGAWGGSKVMDVDGRLVEVPVALPGLAVLVLGLLLLRTKPWYVAVPALATVVAGCAGTMAIHYHLVSAGQLRLDTLGIRLVAGSLAAGLLVGVLGILAAAVSGHRHPRVYTPAAPDRTAPPATG
ncbi:hypothetical protein ACFV6F_14105 [Kitasatospora phosalacinea]|uniref:hypothetical protein n=1 Tax=Kitasatospora phosalacinea TaxID=2065 RepID=UPI003649643E